MSQWFRGRLEGHYVGTGATGPFVSQFGAAARYKMRIYRALIEDIEVLDSDEPLPDETDAEGSFYQAEIEDTRLLGIAPRRCFEGTVYDVAVSQMRITHSTQKGNKTYGRVVGEVVGRILLPPEPEDAVREVVREEVPLTPVKESVEPGSEIAVVDPDPSTAKAKAKAKGRASTGADVEPHEAAPGAREIEPLHAPSVVKDMEEPTSNVPIPLLGLLVAIVLGLAGGATPALLWISVLFPILMIRWMLSGQFRVSQGQRVFGAILVLINLGCLGWLGLDWWTLGHLSMNIAALSGLAITVLIASLLPAPGSLLMTGGGLAVLLFLWYGPVDARPPATESAAETKASPTGTPTVRTPGKPRTNKDGSWPRRN